jgi:hypothetical protein
MSGPFDPWVEWALLQRLRACLLLADWILGLLLAAQLVQSISWLVAAGRTAAATARGGAAGAGHAAEDGQL